MEFIQGDYFKYKTEKLFDGIITDIPYKGCISEIFLEKEFSFKTFLEKADSETKKDAFLITFCNMLCFHDIIVNLVNTNWRYHIYQIWNKEPIRTWISWTYPLRTCEFIIYLKKGDFKFCFKTGVEKEKVYRKNFGNRNLIKTTENRNDHSYEMYSEIVLFKNKKNKKHPTEKPIEFSEMFSQIVGKDKYVLDPFCGSGNLLSLFPNSIGIDVENYQLNKIDNYC